MPIPGGDIHLPAAGVLLQRVDSVSQLISSERLSPAISVGARHFSVVGKLVSDGCVALNPGGVSGSHESPCELRRRDMGVELAHARQR